MSNKPEYRLAPKAKEHASTLCALFNEARNTNRSLPQKQFTLSDFLDVVKGERIFFAYIDDEIVGFASVWEQDRFFHHLYISPRFQRKGIGSSLVRKCIDEFGLPMSLKCIKSNVEACQLYESLGWKSKSEGEGSEGRFVIYIRKNE